MNDAAAFDVPKVSAQQIHRLLNAELSLPSRLGYTTLLLVSLAATSVIASLWFTEPSLPARTRIAFAVMVVIGLSWVTYSIWVLSKRRVLLAGHRIIAARMAIAFSTLFAAGSLALGVWGSVGRAAYGAAATGAVMLAIAIALLLHARTQFAQLMARRRALELEISLRVAP
jgi:hypothetical protein